MLFTARYTVEKLAYYHFYESIEEAIAEEKRLKGGSRAAKLKRIASRNPAWEDLWLKDVCKWCV